MCWAKLRHASRPLLVSMHSQHWSEAVVLRRTNGCGGETAAAWCWGAARELVVAGASCLHSSQLQLWPRQHNTHRPCNRHGGTCATIKHALRHTTVCIVVHAAMRGAMPNRALVDSDVLTVIGVSLDGQCEISAAPPACAPFAACDGTHAHAHVIIRARLATRLVDSEDAGPEFTSQL